MSATQDNAPTAGQGDEGEDQNPSRGTIVIDTTQTESEAEAAATAARHERAMMAFPHTAAADPDIIIRDTPVMDFEHVALAKLKASPSTQTPRRKRDVIEMFSALPVRFTRSSSSAHVSIWRTMDGRWWRKPGVVRSQLMPDGQRAFNVILYIGANEADVTFLLTMVAKARAGEGIDEMWRPVQAEWADELTLKCAMSRPYDDPYRLFDDEAKVVVCTEPRCVEQWHHAFGVHTMETISRETGDGGYDIRAVLPLDADESVGWTVDLQADDFRGADNDVSSLVNDLQWVHEECRRANAERAIKKAAA